MKLASSPRVENFSIKKANWGLLMAVVMKAAKWLDKSLGQHNSKKRLFAILQ